MPAAALTTTISGGGEEHHLTGHWLLLLLIEILNIELELPVFVFARVSIRIVRTSSVS